MTQITIINPEFNGSSVKVVKSDSSETILLPGTNDEFTVTINSQALLITEVPTLMFMEKKL